MRVLVLGGTAEGRALAEGLLAAGHEVVSSLAGRVSRPALPVGEVRTGGFGGVDGLAAHVLDAGYGAVVDATHPFAAGITGNAVAAAERTGVALLRLQRPGWVDHPLAGEFHWVDDVPSACVAAAALGARPFLTTGRQHLDTFADWHDRYVLARVVDPPEWEVPASWEVLRDRGPYPYERERALMQSRRVDLLVTKDSGGAHTEAKLRAARDLGLPVVVVRRPGLPDRVPVAVTVEDALAWVGALADAGTGGSPRA